MYYIVEFTDEGGGGISIIREEWLTPRKQRCLWPPQKLMSKFNKCVDGSINVDGTWETYNIKRIFYETVKNQKLLAAGPEVRATTPVSSDNESTHPPPTLSTQQSKSSSYSLSELDSTLTPNLKEAPCTETLAIIAKHLSRIESDIKELQIGQNEMLQRLRASSATPILGHSLPADIKVPCEDSEDLSKMESWIAIPENRKLLVTYLSLVGGNKTPVIIRRILEKLFTNNLAVLCNWTGKKKN